MADFPDVINVATMDAATGFTVNGVNAGDRLGRGVATGDINGDGIADLLVGAPSDGPNDSGAVYVVFGRADGLSTSINLATLDGTNGFKVLGGGAGANFGGAVTTADVNNDGFDDLIIGARNDGAGFAGSVSVVYGKADGFSAVLDVTNAVAGVSSKLTGFAGDRLGSPVSGIGDYNGDGYEDFLVAAPFADRDGREFMGASYVVMGAAGGLPTNFALSDIDGTNGFELYAPVNGLGSSPELGLGVVGLGDVNDDGFDDFMVSAPYEDTPNRFNFIADVGVGHVFLGHGGANPARVQVADDALSIRGNAYYQTGRTIASAGDFNGDGLADMVVMQPGAGRVVVVYGSTSLPASYYLGVASSVPDGTFSILVNSNALVFGSGDFNGDGFGDLLLSDGQGYSGSGALYVVFGGDTLTGQIALADLVPSRGFRIDGAPPSTAFGSVARSVGDLNGDGADEIAIGAYHADAGGADAGAFTIIWGRPSAVTFTGNSSADVRDGSEFDDAMSGNGGRDTLRGLVGDDALNGGDQNDLLYGGDGADDLIGGLGNDLLDGGSGADAMDGGAGNDTYIVDDLGDTVTEAGGGGSDRVRASVSFTLADDLDNLTLEGTADINGAGNGLGNVIDGNSGANILNGHGGADLIKGGAGDDTLNGGTGADQLLGGIGTDSLDGADDNDRLEGGDGNDIILGGTGADILDGGADNDSLIGGAGADQLLGGAGADSLDGGSENDVLNGGAGADTMTGGTGDDIFHVDDAGDTTVEASGEGSDVVRAALTWTLGDHIERLILDGSADIDGTGNGLANTLTGNAGANTLDGAGGADILSGGLGADRLIGGAGNDILTGGGGLDTFVVRQESVYSSLVPAGGVLEIDTVSDYALGLDRIDLSAIDAIAGGSDDAFTLVGAFTGAGGQMTLTFAGGVTSLALDIDGDRKADYLMKINGDVRADSGNWIL